MDMMHERRNKGRTGVLVSFIKMLRENMKKGFLNNKMNNVKFY